MTANELRQKYLDFFKSKGHVIIPSAPLVPDNDPTTLFTGSGMQPMVPFLLGEAHPKARGLPTRKNASAPRILKKSATIATPRFLKCLVTGRLEITLRRNKFPGCLSF